MCGWGGRFCRVTNLTKTASPCIFMITQSSACPFSYVIISELSELLYRRHVGTFASNNVRIFSLQIQHVHLSVLKNISWHLTVALQDIFGYLHNFSDASNTLVSSRDVFYQADYERLRVFAVCLKHTAPQVISSSTQDRSNILCEHFGCFVCLPQIGRSGSVHRPWSLRI